jgi:hypothetical protein
MFSQTAVLTIITAVLTIIGSSFGAWIAARLAFNRFSREKVWERKAAAYTAIFEAMHHIGKWYEKNLEAAEISRSFDVKTADQLRADMINAKNELARLLASETWLIPTDCRHRLDKMIADLKVPKQHEGWVDYLEEGCSIIATATDDLRKLVVSDLVRARWWK